MTFKDLKINISNRIYRIDGFIHCNRYKLKQVLKTKIVKIVSEWSSRKRHPNPGGSN